MRSSFAILAAVVVLSISTLAYGQAQDVSGVYKYSVTFGENTIETTITLKQEGEKLTGSVTGFQDQVSEISDGKITADGNVAFKVVGEGFGGPRTTQYTGTIKDGVFKGKSEVVTSREFEAKKS